MNRIALSARAAESSAQHQLPGGGLLGLNSNWSTFLAILAWVLAPGTVALWGFAVLIGVTASCRRQRALLAAAGLSLMMMSHQATQAQQVIPNLLGNDFTDPPTSVTVTAGDQANSPMDEKPPKAVDNNKNTKWLALQPNGTFYQIQFNGGVQRAVNAYTISSANDEEARDPYAWTLSGSNDGVFFHPNRDANEPGFRDPLRNATLQVYQQCRVQLV
jgi:hypothetical protein